MYRSKLFLIMIFLVISLAYLIPGCGADDDDDDDDDNWGDDDDGGLDDFLNAIPDIDSLTLSLPADARKGLGGLDELAQLYDNTVDFTREVNQNVLLFLSWIDEITSYPPTDYDENSYTWGPWSPDGLSPVESRFIMTATGDNTYDYQLQWRPKQTDGQWTDVWVGNVVASTQTHRRGEGDFTVYFTEAKALDPTLNEEGEVFVEYDTVSDGREIVVHYRDFYNSDQTMPGPTDGDYFYHNHADDTGEFTFDFLNDIHYVPNDPNENDAYEHLWYRTRWQTDGAGRTDVIINGGDLPDIEVPESTIDRVEQSECWAGDFLRDYYIENVILENGGEYPQSEGNEDDCVFDQAMPEAE